MNGQEWERFGEEIRRTVQNAVDTQDYTRMNQTITNVVNQALNEAAQGIKNFGESVERTARSAEQYRTSRNWKVNNENLYKAGAQAPALYESVISWKAGGVVLSAVGYGIGGSMLLLFLIILLISAFTGNFGIEYQITMVIAAILAGICGVMAWQGTSILGRIKRFKTYIRTLNGREYCDVKELEGAVRKSFKFVIKDLEKMIAKGWFRQGHLDQKKSCFMVSNQMYGQYLQLEEQMRQREEQRRQEEKKAQEEGKMKQSKLDPEVQKIIEQGKDYVRKIRQCNDAIPGEEISAKISRMEMLVGRIFNRVEQNPETVADIRKLMEYYLPTTIKLLTAYRELDSQPVKGENIQTAKREIEATLDTLNSAFEKLLDDLFQETAWDVSSDISVLNMMLAQEGLSENGILR